MKVIFFILACCMPFLHGMEKSVSKERLQKSKRLSCACLPPASTVVEGECLTIKDAALNSWQLMSQLSALRSEALESAHIENSNLSVVLPELVCLQSLSDVSLKNNNYLFYVPDIFALKRLTSLHLADQNADDFFSHSTSLKNLERLTIINGSLTVIPEIIAQSSSLRQLVLRHNDIAAHEVSGTLYDRLTLPTCVEMLDLSYNNLHELVANLNTLTNLRSLTLAGNCLRSIPDQINQLDSITYLNVSNNNLYGLPKYLLKAYKSTDQRSNYFDFSHNFIMKMSKKWVDKNSGSRDPHTPRGYLVRVSLKLNNNLLTSIKGLYSFEVLGELDLSSNDLKKISRKISKCKNLQLLKLNNNNLKTLPESLCSLTKLRYLAIMDNPRLNLPLKVKLFAQKLTEFHYGIAFPEFPKVVKNIIYGYVAQNDKAIS